MVLRKPRYGFAGSGVMMWTTRALSDIDLLIESLLHVFVRGRIAGETLGRQPQISWLVFCSWHRRNDDV